MLQQSLDCHEQGEGILSTSLTQSSAPPIINLNQWSLVCEEASDLNSTPEIETSLEWRIRCFLAIQRVPNSDSTREGKREEQGIGAVTLAPAPAHLEQSRDCQRTLYEQLWHLHPRKFIVLTLFRSLSSNQTYLTGLLWCEDDIHVYHSKLHGWRVR